MNKQKAQRIHAKRRAYERYGLQLNKASYQDIVKLIQIGQTVCVERQSSRISVHELVYQGAKMRVVYDKTRKTIATFLPGDDQIL